MSDVDARVAGLEGEVALPRKNGELVFGAPWEGRVFGMAVVLNEKGAYPWEAFRSHLAGKIREGSPDYYQSWLAAFESLLLESGVVTPEELERRAGEYRNLERDPVF